MAVSEFGEIVGGAPSYRQLIIPTLFTCHMCNIFQENWHIHSKLWELGNAAMCCGKNAYLQFD